MECEALNRVRTDMGLTNVEIMVPFVRTLGQAADVVRMLAQPVVGGRETREGPSGQQAEAVEARRGLRVVTHVRLEVVPVSQLVPVLGVEGMGADLPVVMIGAVGEVDHVRGQVIDRAGEDTPAVTRRRTLLRQPGGRHPGGRILEAHDLVGLRQVAPLEDPRGIDSDEPPAGDDLREARHHRADVLRSGARARGRAPVGKPGGDAAHGGYAVAIGASAHRHRGPPLQELDRELSVRTEGLVVLLPGEVPADGGEEGAEERLLPFEVAGVAAVLEWVQGDPPGGDGRDGARRAGGGLGHAGGRRAARRRPGDHVEPELGRDRLPVGEQARDPRRGLDHVRPVPLTIEQRGGVELRGRPGLGVRRPRHPRGQQQAGRGAQPGSQEGLALRRGQTPIPPIEPSLLK